MRKDPILACLLNLIVVGTGHMYLGRLGKGLVILAMGIVLLMLTGWIGPAILCAWAMFDAYSTAKKMNGSRKKTMPDSTT